ncbi:MAG TPA: tetratricopeptide repeat protein [Tenuifilaceae bacterium]|nr:tetratricopeptide repeat protein [Tenuifilaceae bacterium]HPE18432.1 tetratricopeptide repeat protein [Tenuifilaceae bacterium]HPJ45640.1 tetratricopeptide repeat protein [Tenuifilaceae bacterium]HPQ34193.1 tetratricopeptide repeat protein [Tenuifilaceae bacterium]HRX67231.1 tetratricopeptide repeat protein [Tenuifilaceae bacterium]
MYKSRLLIILSFFIITSSSLAQQSRVDSLTNLLQTAEGIERFDILIELSNENIYEEIGLSYANEAYNLAKKLNSVTAEIKSLKQLGEWYYYQDQNQKSLDYFFMALEIAEKNNEEELIFKNLNSISSAYFYLDSFSKSLDFTNKSLSLSRKIKNKKYEANALLDLGRIQRKYGNYDSALHYINLALKIQEDEKEMDDASFAYNLLGQVYYDLGDYNNSIKFHKREIAIKETLDDLNSLAVAYYNLGRIYRTQGSFQLGLEQYQKSLTTFEKINNTTNVAHVCNEIGLVYGNLQRSNLAIKDNETNFLKGLEYHERALKIFQDQNDLLYTAFSLNNIANSYSRLAANKFVARFGEFWEDSLYKVPSKEIVASFQKAIDSYNQALKIFEEIDNQGEIANVNINLGSHFGYAREWGKAKEHLSKGLRISRNLNNSYDISIALFHLGDINYLQANLEQAEQYFLESMRIQDDLGVKDYLMHNYYKLAKIYERKDDFVKALKYNKLHNQLKDEIFSEKSQKIITEMQTKYETEKKEQEIKLLSNEKALLNSENQRQRLVIFITIGGLLVILVFAGMLINMIRQKQKANKILEEKNELISHQKQEITDSIRYASRIQGAILPSSNLLAESLKEHFVLFLPRDIVSGDFYWFSQAGKKMVLVAADCTGHGVPGAFMSMLGVSFLYEIVNKEGITQPSEILNMLRELIKQTLSQTGKQNEQKDGMDISLSVLDVDNMKLEWAGAYNPLYLIRKGELIEYKADKMPVAIHVNDHLPFTNHEIDLEKGDTFYMFSDGFPDQFGGKDGRKFMSKRFKQLLVEINNHTMDEQREILLQEHLAWRTGYEQIDDVIIFGVRV